MLSFAIETGGKETFDLGDALTSSLRLALPQVEEAASLSVLISGTDPENTTSSVFLCSPTIQTIVKIKYTKSINVHLFCRKISAQMKSSNLSRHLERRMV